MSQDGSPLVEKHDAPVALTPHEHARQLVRLIQCSQCSRPFRNPVTLPCGNSLCRQCLPQALEREGISYPDLPERRHGFHCPFEDCGLQHPASDCSIDVTLSKLMESIAEVVAKYSSITGHSQAVTEESGRWDEVMNSQPSSEKSHLHEYPGGKLVATYRLAAEGHLDYNKDLTYEGNPVDRDSSAALDLSVFSDLLESTQKEVDCQVCYSIMLDPVTTFCGHTLCRKCMARVFDHSLHCPVCRRELAIPPSLMKQPSNKALVSLLNGLCPDTIAARAEAMALEERGSDGRSNVPLFVCTLGFPNQPTFLRIFEPRYRLMLRRAMEGNREFGMLMYNRYNEPQGSLGTVHFYQYGTMLHIIHAQVLADGTSLIETQGMYRFRVKSSDTLDGYLIGEVERLDDVNLAEEERIEAEETAVPVSTEEDMASQINRMSTQDLFAFSKDFIVKMQARSANWLQQRVLDIHGQPPDDPALFAYWFASVLPISDEEKYKLLGTRTVRERLKITATWIRRIESQRWYQSNSCRIL
ncbi:ATP-dependent protease La domain-containing protein [Zymoseptoria brevis]|uniref:ATP-dependent protease La domain-containing protein n=1 Tax=Zymoseptoria brevis TaxID=1047168 RepID=A0A0F4GPJ7_9PEZI|nr:ATP-dependent protease La domain-containing protein [Zymoseptoria brevis]